MIDNKMALFSMVPDEVDMEVYQKVKQNWDGLSKPIDGLGGFETLICRIAAIKGQVMPRLHKRILVVMCADNGIVEEGVSQSGKEITKAVATALGKRISSACSLGRAAGVEVLPVDIGIDDEEEIAGVLNCKVSKGTRNFLKEPAMTEEETLRAINHGIEIVKDLAENETDILACGEMGIGNTTTAAAVLTAILNGDTQEFVGRGAGLSDEGLARKREVIRKALDIYKFNDIDDPKERAFQILRTVGGLDIAGMTGLFIGAAINHMPVIIDGVISSTAALLAEIMVPGARQYMIPSHKGREKGNEAALNALGLEPFINGNMALGEGTGAVMLVPLLDTVMDFYLHGASFSDYEIEEYKRFK